MGPSVDLDFSLETHDPRNFVADCDSPSQSVIDTSAISTGCSTPDNSADIHSSCISDSSSNPVSPFLLPAPPPSFACTTLSLTNSQNLTSFTDGIALFQEHQRLVYECICIFENQGPEALISLLLERGVHDHKSAVPVATIIRTLQKDLLSKAPDTGRNFSVRLRFSAMTMFQEHWKAVRDAPFYQMQQTSGLQICTLQRVSISATVGCEEVSRTLIRGTNIAGFMGSLFTAGIVTADDIHRCLESLMENAAEYDRVCAMHALVVQANDKLCKSKSAPFMKRFREAFPDHNQGVGISRFLIEVSVSLSTRAGTEVDFTQEYQEYH